MDTNLEKQIDFYRHFVFVCYNTFNVNLSNSQHLAKASQTLWSTVTWTIKQDKPIVLTFTKPIQKTPKC